MTHYEMLRGCINHTAPYCGYEVYHGQRYTAGKRYTTVSVGVDDGSRVCPTCGSRDWLSQRLVTTWCSGQGTLSSARGFVQRAGQGIGCPKTCSVSNRDAVHRHIVRCRVSPQYEMLSIIILCYTHHSPLNVEGSVVAQAEAARRRGTRGCRAPLSRLRAA